MTATRRLLAIHPGALGDVLQAVPALRALRGEAGGGHLSLAAQPRLARLLEGAGVVDEALSFEALGLAALFADDPVPPALATRLGAFDGIVSWFGARAPSYAARLTTLAPRVILAAPVPSDDPPALPVWGHLLATLAPLGLSASRAVPETDPLRAPLVVPDEWRARGRAALAAAGLADPRPLLVVHAGAGAPRKRWPVERFAEAIAHAADRCAVLLHEGPADREPVDALERCLDARGVAAGRARLVAPELEALAAVLADAHAYLGGDSGVSHLAAAAGAAAVVLYPEATLSRWTPWGPRACALSISDDGADVERTASVLAGLLRARAS